MNPAGHEGKIDVISRPKSRNIQPKHGTSAQAAQQCNLKSTQAAHWHCDENPANNCENCGRSHSKSEACPARGQTCNYCKKKGHFIQVCRKRMRSKQRIHKIQDTATSFKENFETLAFEPICVGNINQEIKAHKDEVFPTVNVNIPGRGKEETTLKAKIDTGAQGNVLPLRIYRNMYPQNINANGKPRLRTLNQSKVIQVAYGGSEIKHFGTAKIPCEFKGIKITATFYVTDTSSPAIIGLHTATQLNLVKFNLEVKKSPQPEPCTQSVRLAPIGSKQDLIARYPECFDGIGKLKGEYHITLDPAVPPVVHPPRKVPISMKDEVKDELENIVKNDIIAKVQEG